MLKVFSTFQFSSGFNSNNQSQAASAMSSRPSSRMSISLADVPDVLDLHRLRGHHAPGGFSTNLGLARLLNERNIIGGSTISLDKWSLGQHSDVCSLTPSVISSPKGEHAFSPTGTPLNSPVQTPPGTPPNEAVATTTSASSSAPSSSGLFGFFSSLRAALYGEQQKEAQAQILRQKRKKRKPGIKRLGILEKVEEVGVERFMSASPAPSSVEDDRNEKFWKSLSSKELSKYKPDLISDELEEIEPGTLTMSRDGGAAKPTAKTKKSSKKSAPVAGQLKPPTIAPPNLSPNELGTLPLVTGTDFRSGFPPGIPGSTVGGRGPGRVISPCEKRPNLPGVAFGVPGHPGTGALRTDLGFVPVTSVTANRMNRGEFESDQTSFIGSIAQMFFGRKGGLF